mmetsp:Transcript_323/g.1201  ORF Transcript_323/g.1201 Transcript_323/m.1201 type:complete len:99 (+) Transcript_323:474-770(+)
MRELQPGFGQVSGGQCSYYKPVPSSLDDAPVTRRRARDLGASSSEAAANDDKGHKNDIVNNNNNNNKDAECSERAVPKGRGGAFLYGRTRVSGLRGTG